jgi:hypothetical protein
MDEAKCRFVAKAMAGRFSHSAKGKDELRIVAAFAVGLLMVNAGAKPLRSRRESQREETLVSSVILAAGNGASILEEYFYIVLARSSSTPEEVLMQFETTWEEVQSARHFRELLKESAKDARLAEKPGRPTKITQADWPELLQRSTTLLPLCIALLRLQRSARKRSVSALLEFLTLDHPTEVSFLMQHLPKVEAVMTDLNLLAFDLRPQYAMQQALTARREIVAVSMDDGNPKKIGEFSAASPLDRK